MGWLGWLGGGLLCSEDNIMGLDCLDTWRGGARGARPAAGLSAPLMLLPSALMGSG